MRNILKPIFEYITGNLNLFENQYYNWVIMYVIGIIAFIIAWVIVGEFYRGSLISSSEIGSIIHWVLRLIAFLIIYSIISIVIWFIQMLISIPIWAWVALGVFIIIYVIFKEIYNA